MANRCFQKHRFATKFRLLRIRKPLPLYEAIASDLIFARASLKPCGVRDEPDTESTKFYRVERLAYYVLFVTAYEFVLIFCRHFVARFWCYRCISHDTVCNSKRHQDLILDRPEKYMNRSPYMYRFYISIDLSKSLLMPVLLLWLGLVS